MTRVELLLAASAFCTIFGCASMREMSDSQSDEKGFVQLFNGRDLSGWTGATYLFYAEDGDLVFREGRRNYGNLMYDRPFTNFVARFQFKLVPNGNNGFAVRAGAECCDGRILLGPGTRMRNAASNGLEIQVLDNEGDEQRHRNSWQSHGSIYGVVAAQRGCLKPVGEWNDEEVTVNGEDVTVVVNGKVILAASLKDLDVNGGTADGHLHPGLHNKSGYVGFLGHTKPVRFRNIRLKELPD